MRREVKFIWGIFEVRIKHGANYLKSFFDQNDLKVQHKSKIGQKTTVSRSSTDFRLVLRPTYGSLLTDFRFVLYGFTKNLKISSWLTCFIRYNRAKNSAKVLWINFSLPSEPVIKPYLRTTHSKNGRKWKLIILPIKEIPKYIFPTTFIT